MTTPTSETGALQAERAALLGELARLRRRLRLELALEMVADGAIALVAAASVLVALDWWLRPEQASRLVLLAPVAVGLAVFLGLRLSRRSRAGRLDDLGLALVLDRHRPGTGQRVADVLQLPGLLSDEQASASPAMVRLAVRQAREALAESDWNALWNRRRTLGFVGALLAVALVPIAFAALAPSAARLSASRWLLGSDERWPQRTYLSVVGLGDSVRLIAPKGEPFTLEVRADLPEVKGSAGRYRLGGRGEPLALRSLPNPLIFPDRVTLRERTAEGEVRDLPMTAVAPGRYRLELPPGEASSTFELTGGDDWLGPIPIDRVARPSLAAVGLKVREPGATYEGMREVDDPRRHVAFLPDSEIELTLRGDQTLSDAQIEVRPGDPPGLERVDPRSFSTKWTLTDATTIEVRLRSRSTGLESMPAFLSIGLMRDREPKVTLRASGVTGHVTPVATIPLAYAATDDLGLAAARLQAERVVATEGGSKPKISSETIALPLATTVDPPTLDFQTRHDVELPAARPVVGTILRFTGEADDRCARGTQTGHSGAIQFLVVSPDELFYELLIRQRAERARFLALVQAAEARAPILEGSPPKEVYTETVRDLHSTSRQVDQIASRIADSLQEMTLNRIGSPKSHRLLQEGVIDPLRALSAGPLNDLRGMVQTLAGGGARAGADPESVRELHGEVLAEMRAILDQMSQWESFVDVVNQVAEVIKMEQKVLQSTETARESRTEGVFDDAP